MTHCLSHPLDTEYHKCHGKTSHLSSLFCDPTCEHTVILGLLDDTNQDANGLPMTLHRVFILNLDQTIALMIAYSASKGSNIDEIFRVMGLFLLIGASNIATPVDWKLGEEVVVNVPFRDADTDESIGKVIHHLTFVFIHTLVLTRTTTVFPKFHQK